MTIDLAELAKIVGVLSAIIGAAVALVKWVNAYFDKIVSAQLEQLEARVESLDAWNKRLRRDVDNERAYNMVITKGVSACLQGLREQGCNGSVSGAIEEIDDFLLSQANKSCSFVDEKE